MPVTSEEGAVDKAARYVQKRQLITSVGIPPNWRDALVPEQANALLIYCESLNDIAQWTFADLLIWTEEHVAKKLGVRSGAAFWAERDKRWKELLQQSKRDVAHGTLYNMRACAKSFAWERRRHTQWIGFEHHRLLVSFPEEQQEYWLNEAEANEWGSYVLRQKLYLGTDTPIPDIQGSEEQVHSHLEKHGVRLHRQAPNRVALYVGASQVSIHSTRSITLLLEETT